MAKPIAMIFAALLATTILVAGLFSTSLDDSIPQDTIAPTTIVGTVPPTTAPPTTVTTTTIPPTTLPPVTAPPVAAPPAPPVGVVPTTDIEQAICATFVDDCAKALSVVYCESRFNPGTVGAAGERGLFQIHPVHIPYLQDRGMAWDDMFSVSANIAYAYDLYSRSGWGPWTCA